MGESNDMAAPAEHAADASRRRGAAAEIVAGAQLVLDALPRALTVIDADGIIVGWNPIAEGFYGWPADLAIGRSLYELITPIELREPGIEIMSSVLAGERWSGPVKVLRRDGTTRSTLSYLTPLRNARDDVVGVVCAADDTVDLTNLERQTDELSEHLLLALSAGQLGTWHWDRATGAIVWDEQMERLFGLAPGTFDGTYRSWMSMLHPDDVERSVVALSSAFETDAPYDAEHRVIWPDGSVHWLQRRGKRISDDDGAMTGSIGCMVDVTDRKLLEQSSAERLRDAELTAAEERIRREKIEFLANLNEVARDATDHVDLMRRVAAAAVPRLGDWCAVHYRPDSNVLSTRAHERVFAHADPGKQAWASALGEQFPLDPDAPFGVPAVMRSGVSELVPMVDEASLEVLIGSWRTMDPVVLRSIVDVLQLTSVVTVPLVTTRGVVGAMQFVNAESGRHYDTRDLELTESAAARIAQAIDNAWLVEQQRDIAVTLQAALLPSVLPDIPDASIAVRYWAAGAVSDVGGDFYDVFPIDDDAWAIVIGDVCGTGATAAAVTATARHTIRAAATHGYSPDEVLNWVNDAVRVGGSQLFCTVLYSTLVRNHDRTWTYTSVAGGHPLPIVVAPHGTDGAVIGWPGMLIGIVPDIDVHPCVTTLLPGSTLVLHTDGINDVRPPYGLDDDALLALVVAASAVDGAADAVAERLGAAIADILPIPERNDDMAVVVLRVR